MKTLFLSTDAWDLSLDVNGDIAVATSLYQQAQDIASACRVFKTDMYFNQNEGTPYLDDILGKGKYPLALYRKYLTDAALSVPGVVQADAKLTMVDGRVLTGCIYFMNDEGKTGGIGL